jgi:hypothetical protein
LKESIIVNLLIEDLRNNEIFSTNNGVMTVEVDTNNPTVPAQRLVDVLEGLGNTINCLCSCAMSSYYAEMFLAGLTGSISISYGIIGDQNVKEALTARSKDIGHFEHAKSGMNVPLSWGEREKTWLVLLYLEQVSFDEIHKLALLVLTHLL